MNKSGLNLDVLPGDYNIQPNPSVLYQYEAIQKEEDGAIDDLKEWG